MQTPEQNKLTPGKYKDPRHATKSLRTFSEKQQNEVSSSPQTQPQTLADISPISHYYLNANLNQQIHAATDADNEESLRENYDEDARDPSQAPATSTRTEEDQHVKVSSRRVSRYDELNKCMQAILIDETNGELSGRSSKYSDNYLAALPRRLSSNLRESLKTLLGEFPNYRFVVHVYATHRQDDVKMGVQCFWDASEDLYFTYVYADDEIYCISTAFAIKY